jgi:hypothetical protein
VRFLLDVDGDDGQVIHLLRRLLKVLKRQFGIRAARVEEVHSDGKQETT